MATRNSAVESKPFDTLAEKVNKYTLWFLDLLSNE